MSQSKKNKFIRNSTVIVASMTTLSCISPNGDFSHRTSLFGNSARSSRALPLPSQIQTPQAQGRSLQLPDNVPPSGTILPQLSGAMAGNSSHGGFTKPMISSPLMFQRLDKNTWRVATHANHLFQTLARILSQNYIIAKADRQTLSLNTEWDKFFIDGRLFRNRVSINVFPVNPKTADLIIKNNVEYYTQTAQKIDNNDPTQWLPTQDVTDELEKILDKTQKQLIASLSGGVSR